MKKENYLTVKKLELTRDFTQIPNSIFTANLTATEKLILIYLMSNSESFRITNYRIKVSIGSDFRTVKKALNKFNSLGLITYINPNTIKINVGALNSSNSTSSNCTPNSSNSTSSNCTPNSSNSTSSNSTSSNSTSSNCTPIDSSNSTPIDSSNCTPNSSNSTPKIVVELHNNNTNQDQIKKDNNNNYNKEIFCDLGLDSDGIEIQSRVDKGSYYLITNINGGISREYKQTTDNQTNQPIEETEDINYKLLTNLDDQHKIKLNQARKEFELTFDVNVDLLTWEKYVIKYLNSNYPSLDDKLKISNYINEFFNSSTQQNIIKYVGTFII